MSTALDPLALPLRGPRLIEASAGTGKTYTIAQLYLRLLLETRYAVTELLVVTFTNAATEELRERIRARLVAAIAHLESHDGAGGDDFLDALIASPDAPPPVAQGDLFDSPPAARRPSRDDAIQRLRDAVTRMDEAAIFTIHGFCQRALADAAFESGAWFDAELSENTGDLLSEACEDFWRRHFYPAPLEFSTWVARTWANPDALRRALLPLRQQARVILEPADAHAQMIDAEAGFDTAMRAFLSAWPEARTAIKAIVFAKGTRLSQAQANYHPDRLGPLFTALDALDRPTLPLPPNFDLLSRERLERAIGTRGQEVGDHALFDLGQRVLETAARLDARRRAYWLGLAHAEIEQAMQRRKRELGRLGFDDLLGQLASALEEPPADNRGEIETGTTLAARLRTRFPVAMIDEFQDTDPLQYAIFSRVYLTPEADATALLLIGDPKQAIYAFRGADVFTYMRARAYVTELDDAHLRHYSLDTNWRATRALIDALNTLFTRAGQPFGYAEIPYEPVRAGGNADAKPLRIKGALPPPLAGWLLPSAHTKAGKASEWSRQAARVTLAARCAGEIAHLLECARRGDATLGGEPLGPGDFAVLVRSHHEADAIRAALDEAAVPSVYLARDSVFETTEAEALHRVLLAVARPWDRNAVRVALGGELIGLDAVALRNLEHDEPAWETYLDTLQALHQRWLESGFMAMFLDLLHRLPVIARARGGSGRGAAGERRLTNLLQLAELMQIASAAHPGMVELLDWLGRQRQTADGDNEAQQLRLESDAARVRIVTIHKSKGLQYPLVFLPFIGFGPSTRRDADVLLYHDDANALRADLGSAEREAHRATQRHEALAEDMRLLYVALTRAEQRCYLGWGRFANVAEGALWRLLAADRDPDQAPAGRDDDALFAPLRDLPGRDGPAFEVLPTRTVAATPGEPAADDDTTIRARVFPGLPHDDWRITSFTALTQASGDAMQRLIERPDHDQGTERVELADASPSTGTPPGGDDPDTRDAGLDGPGTADSGTADSGTTDSGATGSGTGVLGAHGSAGAATPRDRHAFPRGAHAGVLLHGILETLDFTTADPARLRDTLGQRLTLQGFDATWAPLLGDWLCDVLDASFGDGIRLRALSRRQRLDELEFHFPLARLDAGELNALLVAPGTDGDTPPLHFAPRRGLMKGYIDLVFEHDGRFHLADYKSNHLGADAEAYAPEPLNAAMAEHRYDLQARIYAVALHRYLRARIRDYRYAEHFGGIHYLFLRGMSARHAPGHGVVSLRPSWEEIDALDRLFAG